MLSPSAESVTRPLGATAYLAVAGFERELCDELGIAPHEGQRLYVVEGPPRPVAWAANVWLDVVEITFPSIGSAAKAIRALGRNWVLLPGDHHRRASLIDEKLPHVSAKPLVFPMAAPTAPLGSFTLTAHDRLLAAPVCSSPFANGEAQFVEDRDGPPSRAYLKLWEAFSLARRWPKAGDLSIDLGACPGGWTWVLQRLGAKVVAVDKAPLDPRIAALPGVSFRGESAFAIDPAHEPRYDWIVSDIACYPERLRQLLERWLAAQPQANFIVTVKFQGATDMRDVTPLAAIPGSRLLHLHHNKHELTWIKLAEVS